MDKAEFLAEVGRLADRLWPEEKEPIPYSREWWGRNVDARPEDIPEEMILAFARGEPVWNVSTKYSRSGDRLRFDSGAKNYSLTDPALPKPKKYRPWTWADRGLVPDTVLRKSDQRVFEVENIRKVSVGSGCGWTLYWLTLFQEYTQPDGSPCGVEVAE